MNSAFIIFLFFTIIILLFLHFINTILIFSWPKKTIQFLSYLTIMGFILALGLEMIMWNYFHEMISNPRWVNMFIGLSLFSYLAFWVLILVEHPTQLHRKIMWRMPIIGAFIGYSFIKMTYLGWILLLAIQIIFMVKNQKDRAELRWILYALGSISILVYCYFTKNIFGIIFYWAFCFCIIKMIHCKLLKNILREKLL